MGILRKASTETKRIQLDEESYIDVVSDVSQGDLEKLLSELPEGAQEEGNLSIRDTLIAQHILFEIFVQGWSLPDPVTVESFKLLHPEAAREIGAKLGEHFNSLNLTEAESKGRKK